MSAKQSEAHGADGDKDDAAARDTRSDEAAPSPRQTPRDMGSLSEDQPHEYGDEVDVSSEESFPASDPPAWSSGTT